MANTLDKLRLSGVTYDIIDSTALHTIDDTVTSGSSNPVKSSGVYNAVNAVAQAVAEQHYQTSGDVQSIVTASISGKADASDVYTKTEVYTKGETDQAISDAIIEAGGVTSGTVQGMIDASISGKTDETDFTAFTSSTDTALGTKFQNVSYNSTDKKIYFYTEGATTGTPAAYVDATDFIKDGMVSNVEIKTIQSGDPAVSVTVLAITFNADAGKEEIDIPISSIFDATNYYTKSETDAAISAATSGKASQSDVETLSGTVTGMNATLTAHTADTDVHVTTSDKTTWSGKQNALTAGDGIRISGDVISVTGAPLAIDDTVTSGSANPVKSSGIYSFVTGETSTKQDTLVNQTNIKSVGGESLLGSGNVTTLHAEVSGTTLILNYE